MKSTGKGVGKGGPLHICSLSHDNLRFDVMY